MCTQVNPSDRAKLFPVAVIGESSHRRIMERSKFIHLKGRELRLEGKLWQDAIGGLNLPLSPDCIKAPPQNHSPLNRGALLPLIVARFPFNPAVNRVISPLTDYISCLSAIRGSTLWKFRKITSVHGCVNQPFFASICFTSQVWEDVSSPGPIPIEVQHMNTLNCEPIGWLLYQRYRGVFMFRVCQVWIFHAKAPVQRGGAPVAIRRRVPYQIDV